MICIFVVDYSALLTAIVPLSFTLSAHFTLYPSHPLPCLSFTHSILYPLHPLPTPPSPHSTLYVSPPLLRWIQAKKDFETILLDTEVFMEFVSSATSTRRTTAFENIYDVYLGDAKGNVNISKRFFEKGYAVKLPNSKL